MERCRSATSMVAVRVTGSALAETRYPTDPSPCPFADDVNPIHGDCVVTFQVQSRSTVIETVPVPPVEPKDPVEEETFGWHRAVVVLDGAATLVVAELPQAIVSKSTQADVAPAKKSRRRIFRRGGHSRGVRRTLQLSCRKVASDSCSPCYTEVTPAEHF
jgi:hypothetical protein